MSYNVVCHQLPGRDSDKAGSPLSSKVSRAVVRGAAQLRASHGLRVRNAPLRTVVTPWSVQETLKHTASGVSEPTGSILIISTRPISRKIII